MGFGRWAPGQLDEAGGNQRRHDVSGCGGGGACCAGYTSGAWRYMVSSVRSQWGGRERGKGYIFGLGGGRRKEVGREELAGWVQGHGQGKKGGTQWQRRRGEGGGQRNITQRRPNRDRFEERSWNGNDSGTKKERKKGNKKKKKKQNNNNVTKKDFWRDKEPQK